MGDKTYEQIINHSQVHSVECCTEMANLITSEFWQYVLYLKSIDHQCRGVAPRGCAGEVNCSVIVLQYKGILPINHRTHVDRTSSAIFGLKVEEV